MLLCDGYIDAVFDFYTPRYLFFLTTCYFLYDGGTVFFVNIFNIFTRHSNIIDIIAWLLL